VVLLQQVAPHELAQALGILGGELSGRHQRIAGGVQRVVERRGGLFLRRVEERAELRGQAVEQVLLLAALHLAQLPDLEEGRVAQRAAARSGALAPEVRADGTPVPGALRLAVIVGIGRLPHDCKLLLRPRAGGDDRDVGHPVQRAVCSATAAAPGEFLLFFNVRCRSSSARRNRA